MPEANASFAGEEHNSLDEQLVGCVRSEARHGSTTGIMDREDVCGLPAIGFCLRSARSAG